MKVVRDWRIRFKHWSFQLGAAAWALIALMISWPESTLAIWALLPDETRAIFPPRFAMMFPIILGALSLFLKFVIQPKLEKEKADGASPAG